MDDQIVVATFPDSAKDDSSPADSIVSRGATIDFQNISAVLHRKDNKSKTILSSVSATVNAGRLTALMGVRLPSDTS